MNLSLASIQIGPRHTAFITLTGTILYNAHSILHDRDADTTTTTTVTTIGESGDTLAGFIHWPRNIDQRAVVIVGGKQLRLTPLDSRDDAMCLTHDPDLTSHIYIFLGR